MFQKLNIHQELIAERKRGIKDEEFRSMLREIIQSHEDKTLSIRENLEKENDESYNTLDFDALETSNIFHIDTIKKICVDYRLRFLDTKYFKGVYPKNIEKIIGDLESKHETQLKNFKIMAPSKLFKLRSPDDPLLFVPMGNGYYYLVHTWGNDLNSYRKFIVQPFRSPKSMLVFSLCTSVILATLVGLFNSSMDVGKIFTLFLFILKAVVFLMFYFFFMVKKNFNSVIWNNRFY
ncbi:MAG: hypothetical protein ACPHXR_01795 [Flavicella sp.]